MNACSSVAEDATSYAPMTSDVDDYCISAETSMATSVADFSSFEPNFDFGTSLMPPPPCNHVDRTTDGGMDAFNSTDHWGGKSLIYNNHDHNVAPVPETLTQGGCFQEIGTTADAIKLHDFPLNNPTARPKSRSTRAGNWQLTNGLTSRLALVSQYLDELCELHEEDVMASNNDPMSIERARKFGLQLQKVRRALCNDM